MIRMRGVRKSFGALDVLRELNLDVRPQEKVSLIGPSGSGKSTILRITMTLEKINAGDLEIDGESVWSMTRNGQKVAADKNHLSKIRRKVGMVFQSFNLFPHMPVIRNVTEAPIHVLGLSRDEAREQGRELLDMVGLRDKEDAYPGQLSGGQKQRVAIARALAMQPKIMLFDEITSALDPELVGEVLNVLRDLAHRGNITMLLVTHQMNFAREISDRVLFLEGGRIVEEGAPSLIFENPKEDRTRQFLKTILEA
ncbi:MAG: ectoine/hydroxyectoine ABC transporter ATP-binding protein EhuA [Nitrospinaceae bacterium]|nr:ectoine/hydroxyectoine ABC transporter ATP-binding protein EhuA [Nitrospinaceae bacterium]NIR57144.1 ectoine/hydroxyectoine ABC transporter ATP-binding protein EhuA [Nitrospinaceae bacterium]NIS87586.1 ectoine/hydroxyectoine ABC transporter ATP-binding protein EhuA [Nitrospinaceae bacterium]NIT84455.1 ectoine/hydroxyectoine ABC transporter ATP-binding protein EhuA [Nitrospinaceae bacterium]NIU46643.1 ectoine/hydroxyectoine ABC transporter ATP-binding protein EhuA [Nitrospinaceae bacterium]